MRSVSFRSDNADGRCFRIFREARRNNIFIDNMGMSAYGPLFAMSLLAIFGFFLAFQRLLIEGVAISGL